MLDILRSDLSLKNLMLFILTEKPVCSTPVELENILKLSNQINIPFMLILQDVLGLSIKVLNLTCHHLAMMFYSVLMVEHLV